MRVAKSFVVPVFVCCVIWAADVATGQRQEEKLTFPPALPAGKIVVSDRSDDFLRPPSTLRDDVKIAATAPTIDFALFPGQDYRGNPWSAWGESTVAGNKYYASIGDHLAPAGNAFVYEYDLEQKSFRKLLDLRALLKLPAGHYAPGKIHTRLDLGSDGWLFCATHRGSTRVTTDEYHYRGDWIVRCRPETGEAEVVVQAPVPKHCIPNGALDPKRLIFYGGTTPGSPVNDAAGQFFAYDVQAHKLLFAGPNGPARSMIVATSSGKVYFTPGNQDAPLYRFDPKDPARVVTLDERIGIRAATRESSGGKVYTVSVGQDGREPMFYAFDTRRESVSELGPAAVGAETYIASLAADAAGRFVYYVPGAHGGGDRDGSPVVQFDTQKRQKKVIAFLHPFYQKKYALTPKGTYSVAVDSDGKQVFITWNVSRGGRSWDCCALTVVHVPDLERRIEEASP
jgi:hypothetical protein